MALDKKKIAELKKKRDKEMDEWADRWARADEIAARSGFSQRGRGKKNGMTRKGQNIAEQNMLGNMITKPKK